MIIFHHTPDMRAFARRNEDLWRQAGFVPTMGALHEGHLALVAESRRHCPLTVVSIFVNPTQFNDPSDYEKYPVTFDSDIRKLEAAGCDILFLPGVADMYPDGMDKLPVYDLGELETLLEGKYRPGHFQGVCQVVHRLLLAVQPSHLFMGRKDYQQCMVVNRLLELTGLPVELHRCPTLRATDGLALSSRNMRLNETERRQATAIYRAMDGLLDALGSRPVAELESLAAQQLLDTGFRSVDYVSVADPVMLRPIHDWQPGQDAVVVVAAFLGDVRLIDNLGTDERRNG